MTERTYSGKQWKPVNTYEYTICFYVFIFSLFLTDPCRYRGWVVDGDGDLVSISPHTIPLHNTILQKSLKSLLLEGSCCIGEIVTRNPHKGDVELVMDLLPEEIPGQGEFDGQGLRNSNMVSINGKITLA
jgi:hypothetical protein